MLSEIIPIDDWGLFLLKNRPIIISGPCSAESEEMIVETASELKKIGVNVLRAGLWKPRTNPSTFEGVGEIGLPWLTRVQKELGMKVGVEVANVKHVEAALTAGIDFFWIGARTTGNPFAVQEIAEALKGINIPVFVKNPINPDIELWIGAVERLYNVGLRKIGVIHRGFYLYEKIRYRHNPLWQIPIEMKRRFPNLSIICDPSHIAGKSEYIEELSRLALNIGFDGLMVETHLNPSQALSDSDQQITPAELKVIIQGISIRKREIENNDVKSILEEYRTSIDRVDQSLIDTLALRMELVDKIGSLKKESQIAVLQTERWNDILKMVTETGAAKNLDKKFIERLFKLIHQTSIDRQLK